MAPLSDNQQAISVIVGAGLCVGGVYYAIKVDPTTGGGMIAAGLAILGVKEIKGSKPAASTTQSASTTPPA